MEVTTGLPSMVPLYILLYYFTMTTSSFSPNFFIPSFTEICVNIKFVAIFMNESVSYFDYFYLIKIFLTCMSSHKNTLPIGLFLRRISTFLV